MAEDLTLSDIDSMLQELYHASGAPYFFDDPFIGIAAADDPFFVKFKDIIGSHHWTPEEALHFAAPEAKAQSVIVWILPVNQRVRESNHTEKNGPSKVWASMRSFGEQCNENMRRQLCRLLQQKGYAAIAMDTCGGIPVWSESPYYQQIWPRHAHSGPAGWQQDEISPATFTSKQPTVRFAIFMKVACFFTRP